MKIIEAKELVTGYSKNKPIIKGVSFAIEEGSFTSIIGHNGSGKSTLAKVLAGLLPISSGEITIFGKKLNNETINEIRQHLAIVFQNPDNQFIGATVEDDVAFGLENRQVEHKDMKPLVKEFLTKVGMFDYLEKEPSNLSGGQKQRVALAGALILKPSILILDEATAMLDPKGKQEILDLILLMKKENPKLTIISITHNIEETYLSDQIILMEQGQIVLTTTPLELYKNKAILEQYKIEAPFIYELINSLRDNGISIPDLSSLEEVSDYLCRLK